MSTAAKTVAFYSARQRKLELNKVIDGTVARVPLNKNVKLSLQVDEGLGA